MGIGTAVVYETKPTAGIQIVDVGSSDPGIARLVPIPIDANHVDICKPESRSADVFVHILHALRQWFSPDFATTDTAARIVARIDWGDTAASSDHLRKAAREVGAVSFPDGDIAFPQGSRLAPTDGSTGYALKKPSVALRGAIEFLQTWHGVTLKGSPDCRVVIGDARIDKQRLHFLDFSSDDLRGLAQGSLYVAESIADATDPTMAIFVPVGSVLASGRRLFRAVFEDPRTTRDSSLIHALFVAHPSAEGVRRRLVELFLIEYVMEFGGFTSFDHFTSWMREHTYPSLSKSFVLDVLSSSEYFRISGADGSYCVTDEPRAEIEKQRASYAAAKTQCLDYVAQSIVQRQKAPKLRTSRISRRSRRTT